MKPDVHRRIGLLHLVGCRREVIEARIGGVLAARIDEQAQHAIIGWIVVAAQWSDVVSRRIRQHDIIGAVRQKAVGDGDVTIEVVRDGDIRVLPERRLIEKIVLQSPTVAAPWRQTPGTFFKEIVECGNTVRVVWIEVRAYPFEKGIRERENTVRNTWRIIKVTAPHLAVS